MFTSVGSPLPTEGKYAENHWRRTDRGNRLYETHLVNYAYESGFEPEEYSYDFGIDKKGFKWPLAQEFIRDNQHSLMNDYEYIGVWDDDIQTDIESVNHALVMAYNVGAKMFQLALEDGSDAWYDCLKHDPKKSFTLTNFIEIMCPVYHTSLIPKMLEFWDMCPLNTGWGFDKVACYIFNTPAMVIHSKQMYHPVRGESTYDKTAAFKEMDICLNQAYPKFMEKHYGPDHQKFVDRQFEYAQVWSIP